MTPFQRKICLTCKFNDKDFTDYPCVNCDNGSRQAPIRSPTSLGKIMATKVTTKAPTSR